MSGTTPESEHELYDPAAAGLRVAQLMHHRGWSGRELARRAELSATHTHHFLRGEARNVQPKTYSSLARALGWPTFAALMASTAMEPPQLAAPVPQLGPTEGTTLVDRITPRPFNSAGGPGSRGRGVPAGAAVVELPWLFYLPTPIQGRVNSGNGEGYVSEPVDVPVDVVRGRNFSAWEVAGTCMEPELSEGDDVLIDHDQRPVDGDIVVARYRSGGGAEGAQLLLKRYYRRTSPGNGEAATIELRPNIEAAGVGEAVIAPESEVEILGVVFRKMRAVGRGRPGQLSWATDRVERLLPSERAG